MLLLCFQFQYRKGKKNKQMSNFNSPGFICNLWMQCIKCFFLQFGASWKEVEYAIIINHVPHWMAVISELSHFCLPQENLVNNDYWSTVTFLIWEGHFHCVFFFFFCKNVVCTTWLQFGEEFFPLSLRLFIH